MLSGTKGRMMSGTDGREKDNIVSITWEQFKQWQRWDEFPERRDDPPMTVDMKFWFDGKEYYLDCVGYKYVILSEKSDIIASNNNFLSLLTKPIDAWDKKTFQELIGKMLFQD